MLEVGLIDERVFRWERIQVEPLRSGIETWKIHHFDGMKTRKDGDFPWANLLLVSGRVYDEGSWRWVKYMGGKNSPNHVDLFIGFFHYKLSILG